MTTKSPCHRRHEDGEDRTYLFLNERGHSLICAKDFVYTDRTPTCQGFQSMDPRTFDSPRNDRLVLDRPPIFSRDTQPQKHMYEAPGGQTGFYPGGYQDMRNGSIFYYIDRDFTNPYQETPYTLPCRVLPQIEIDPMGAFRPIYQRIPLFQNNRSASAYTFDQDQIEFREDLMALQSRKINESDYQLYHGYKDHLFGSVRQVA